MTKNVVTVEEEIPLKEVLRLIFSLGIGGMPVVRGKKVIGIITDEDILSRVFPSVRDVIQDFGRASDFEEMEKNIVDLLEKPVKTMMTKDVATASPDTPLLKAQSTMLLNSFHRLPVVDKKRNLVGIISQGDIFDHLLKHQLPKIEKERFVSFTGRHYDSMINWKKRFAYELPVLFKIFKKEKVKKIIDLGVWTGEHTLGVLKRGYKRLKLEVLGLDHNPAMIQMCNKKKEKLPVYLRNKIEFMLTDFANLDRKIKYVYDAAISMGNGLAYIPATPQKLFKGLSPLLKKNGVLILQLLNFEKILNTRDRLLSFRIQDAQQTRRKEQIKEHLFVEFLDKKRGDLFRHITIVFDSDGKDWIYGGKTTGSVRYLSRSSLKKTLKKAGFSKISFSGAMGRYHGEYGLLTFGQPFDPLTSDWLLVKAKK